MAAGPGTGRVRRNSPGAAGDQAAPGCSAAGAPARVPGPLREGNASRASKRASIFTLCAGLLQRLAGVFPVLSVVVDGWLRHRAVGLVAELDEHREMIGADG